MSLSCECGSDYEFYYNLPNDYSVFPYIRRKRCCSCNNLINPNDLVAKFYCYRNSRDDIEDRIHGDEVMMANKYMCEPCADIFFNLQELGFCINLGESMGGLFREYKENYAPPKINPAHVDVFGQPGL